MGIKQIIEANGWFFVLVFSAASFWGVFLIAWRFLMNYHSHLDVDAFVSQVEQEIATGGGKRAFEFCERESIETQHLLPKLFVAAFREGHQGMIAARDAIAECLDTELMPSLHRLLSHMLLLAKVAPMLGLLGTVMGMIGAFGKIAGATRVNPQDLSNDIGMALYTTAEGLFIAIPVIFFYTLFQERVRRFELDLQRGSQAALKLIPKVFQRPAA